MLFNLFLELCYAADFLCVELDLSRLDFEVIVAEWIVFDDL